MGSKLVLMSLLLCFSLAFTLHAREWTDKTGVFTVEAELVEVAGTTVRLKKSDGTIIAVPLQRLSITDQQYLKSLNKKAPKARESVPGAAEAAIETALTQPTQWDFDETPLSHVLAFLADGHAIQIFLDRRSLADAGIGSDVPITARHRQGDLARNLDAMLDPLDLTSLVRYDSLFVTTKKSARAMCEVRVYRLLRQVSFDDVFDEIARNIDPESWDTVGGPGALSPVPPDTLVVRQMQANHRQIDKHYEGLLKRIRSPVPAETPELVGPAVAKALSESTAIEFINAPLKEAVAFLENDHDLEIAINVQSLNDVGLGIGTPVTVNVKGVRLSSALSLMLRQLGLTWTADKTGIRITTPEDAQRKTELIHYPVNGLVQPGQADHLIEAITRCVAPENWDEVGGLGSILMGIRGTLDVRQSFAIHQEVAQLLADLREARKP